MLSFQGRQRRSRGVGWGFQIPEDREQAERKSLTATLVNL